MNTFTINGTEYTATPFTFNTICELDDFGIDISNVESIKPMSFIRAYFAICAKCSKEVAGDLLGQHMMNGGNLDELSNAMNSEMTNSGFFQALSKTEKKTTSAQKKKA